MGQYNDITPIFWATGACFAIRSNVFHKVGGFDESFFAHMEEIDLCWRIQLMGYKVFYNGQSQVYHVDDDTLPKTSPKKTYLIFRNGLSMLYKNTYSPALYFILPLRILLDVVASIKFLVSNSWENSLAVFKGILDSLKKYRINKEKKAKFSVSEHPYIKEIYKHSIVVEYYIK